MPRFKSWLPSLFISLLLCACSSAGLTASDGESLPSAATPALHKEKSMPATPPTLPPTRDAAEVLRRLLTLIDHLKTPEDLNSPETVIPFTGVTMGPKDERSPSKYSDSGLLALNDIWWYDYTWGLNGGSGLPDIGIGFYEMSQYPHDNPPLTSICQMDLDQFHAALLAMGYKHYANSRGSGLIREYQRGLVLVDVNYVGESEERVTHNCIKSVSVGFLTRYIEFRSLP